MQQNINIKEQAKLVKIASPIMAGTSEELRNKALKEIATELENHKEEIFEANKKDLEQAKKEDFMYCAVGIHPENAEEILKPDSLETLKKLAADSKVKAIGECGLDYHYEDAPEKDIQKQAFIRQIDLANELDLPMIIHTRDAMADTIDILTAHPLKNGVIHCYSGSRESCKQLIKMGFYIGFTGVITFKNARRAIESMKVVPLDKLLIETDCPYMEP